METKDLSGMETFKAEKSKPQMTLKPDSLLKRTGGIEIRLDSSHEVEITVNGRPRRFSNSALAILDTFSYPLSLRQAMEKLSVNRPLEWTVLTGTIVSLYHHGVLQSADRPVFTSDKDPESFGAPFIHFAMLNDRVRTECFINAIKETVKEGDVVIDIGTGTGILAIAAARAGAKKVYAIEAGAMADIAQGVIESSGLSQKITLVRGWSTHIELPEKADVLISEIIGNEPFTEKVLQTFMDARKRLLTDAPRILPGAMKVFGLPVQIDESMLRNRILREEDLRNWKDWYGLDLSVLKDTEAERPRPFLTISKDKGKELISGKPLLLAEINFSTFEDIVIETETEYVNEQQLNGMLVYFELFLGSGQLTSHPKLCSSSSHWLNTVWFLPGLGKKGPGESIKIRYAYGKGRGQEIFIR
jgi:hypothetical protein